MKTGRFLFGLIIFLIGFFSSNFLNSFFSFYENPLSNNFNLDGYQKKAPSDYIKEDNIKIYNDRIVIYVNEASISSYASSGSMIPVLDENSNGIRIKPNSEKDINVGDIISFERNNNLIVHRVIKKSYDENGVYFITKGDNNSLDDGKVRFNEIKYKTIGVLW